MLYETLTGSAPFRRGTTADTVSAVLNDEPAEIGPAIPPALEQIVRRCLAKDPENRFQSARDLMFDLDALRHSAWPDGDGKRRPKYRTASTGALAGAGLVAIIAAAAVGYVTGKQAAASAPAAALLEAHRVTDFVGMEESPAISPDGRSVAFTASVNGRRQIFVRLLTGGPPLALTKDEIDHQFPRWAPDGNSLLFFAAPQPGEREGAIWAIPALGGPARQIIHSVSGADVSRSGRLASFQLGDGAIRLVTAALDGSDSRALVPSSSGYHRYPRWSPDGNWIAFERGDGLRYDIFVVPAGGGDVRQLTHDRTIIDGIAWLPSSAGVVFGSSRGSTIPYLPMLRLWEVGLDAKAPRPLTPGDVSYEQPDVHQSGRTSATRLTMRSDLWSFPIDGAPADNTAHGRRISRQTGQVLTPSASPDGREIAFLGDSGSHANLWVISTTGGDLRQITFERDPFEAVGLPVWSPNGHSIAFVSSKGRTGFDFGIWLVNPDGGNVRNVASAGLGPAWSADGAGCITRTRRRAR